MNTTIEKTPTKIAVAGALTKDQIAFQRGLLIVPATNSIPLNKQEKFSLQAEDALNVVNLNWFSEIIPFLKKRLGVGNYLPFYKNFPTQVMELSTAELYWNAIIHYWSLGTWEPSYELRERGFAFENTKFTTIKLGSEDDFRKIFTTLVSINQSITENDKKIVEWFVENYSSGIVMPKTIPFKETLCMLAGYGLQVPVSTATDVLRIATYFSGGDISLPAVPKVTVKDVRSGRKEFFFRNLRTTQVEAREKFKFKNLSRSRRKYLLALLEQTNVDLGEMKLKLERWLRLGEVLHVGEFKTRFPKAYEAFDALRNNAKEIKTFESKLEDVFVTAYVTNENTDLVNALNLLSKRPGVFARKLDWLLRTFDSQVVLESFKKIASKVSKKVLWELYNHFLNRDTKNVRTVMIKGKKAKKRTLPELPPMSKIMINKIQNTILSCLSEQFGQLESLGTVWIDDKLKKVPLPTGMRSANTSLKTYMRGTRVPFGEGKKVVRPYVHWNDQYGNEDIDLSVGFYDENLKGKSFISYSNPRIVEYNSCHSGDVRQRKGACAEYVDIDIEKCLSKGVRYAMVQVYNFQQRPMHTMKDCVFGIMEREFPESNPIFVPKTITNAVTIANESSTVAIAILDLKEREYIWLDLELQSNGLANIESTSSMLYKLIRGAVNNSFLSVYDLFMLHAESRGKLISDKEKATTVFEFDEYVTGYDKVATFM
jgi:hypothetical protein